MRALGGLPIVAAGYRLPPTKAGEEKVRLPKNVIYYGVDRALPEQIPLRAGPLSLVYEEGDLRYIRLGDREILRRVYVAIRDRNWGTILPRFSRVQMDVKRESFRISYEVENKQGEIDFYWRGTLTGDEGGNIRFAMEGVARSTFLKNRIGFCVLHPVRECAGQPCVVEQVDGKVLKSSFPGSISPNQPFLDMRAVSHEVAPGLAAEVRMEGENFEMEDHRNWTDASYKTYCTPLRFPFPVELTAGTRVTQLVSLNLKGTVPSASAHADADGVVLRIAEGKPVPLPRIGLGSASHGEPLSPKEIERLSALKLFHLRVDLRLMQPEYEAALSRAAREAGELRLPLEMALFVSNDAENELRRLRASLDEEKPAIARWLVFHAAERSTTAKWIQFARQFLADYDPKAPIGGGANANFAELNRGRPPAGLLDCASYSMNPQVHAFDNASLAENLAAQAATVESARQFAGITPVVVSPVTLRQRFNPVATGPEPPPPPGELPPQVDVRQMSLFGAAWTLGSIKYLAESGVQSATYYETTGWRGVMETERGSPISEKFGSIPAAVFPLYHVLAGIGEFAGGAVLPSVSSAPLAVEGLVLRRDGRQRTLLANLTDKEQKIRIEGSVQGNTGRMRVLDETNAVAAMTSPESFRRESSGAATPNAGGFELRLRPYAFAMIDQDYSATG